MKLIKFVGITDIRYTDWNGNLTKLQEEIPIVVKKKEKL